MKEKMTKRMLGCLLAALLFLAGCSSGGTENSNTQGSSSSESMSTASKDKSPEAEPVTFPLKEKQTLTAFVITPFAGSNGDYQDNWVTSILEEQENIRIDFQTCASGEDGKTKLCLLYTSRCV